MASRAADLTRQLSAAVDSFRDGINEDGDLFVNYFQEQPAQAQELLLVVVDIWKHPAKISNVASSDSLRAILRIASIAQQACVECIKCIQAAFISGKSALYCVSEIRMYMVSVIELSINGRSDTISSSRSSSYTNKYSNTRDFFYDVGMACIYPLLSEEEGVSLSLRDAQQFAYCIELFPVVLSSLQSIHKQLEEFLLGNFPSFPSSSMSISQRRLDISNSRSSSSSSRATAGHSQQVEVSNLIALTMDKMTDLIESLFFADWGQHVIICICNTLCEIYDYLSEGNLLELNVRLRRCHKSLKYNTDNISGMLHICIRLFDRSRDTRWIHALRILYMHTPFSAAHAIESLLEHTSSNSLQSSHLILAVLEDTAVHMQEISNEVCAACSSSSSSPAPLNTTNGNRSRERNTDRDSYATRNYNPTSESIGGDRRRRGRKNLPPQDSDTVDKHAGAQLFLQKGGVSYEDGSHVVISGIPAVTVFDVRLAMCFIRAVSSVEHVPDGSSNSGGGGSMSESAGSIGGLGWGVEGEGGGGARGNDFALPVLFIQEYYGSSSNNSSNSNGNGSSSNSSYGSNIPYREGTAGGSGGSTERLLHARTILNIALAAASLDELVHYVCVSNNGRDAPSSSSTAATTTTTCDDGGGGGSDSGCSDTYMHGNIHDTSRVFSSTSDSDSASAADRLCNMLVRACLLSSVAAASSSPSWLEAERTRHCIATCLQWIASAEVMISSYRNANSVDGIFNWGFFVLRKTRHLESSSFGSSSSSSGGAAATASGFGESKISENSSLCALLSCEYVRELSLRTAAVRTLVLLFSRENYEMMRSPLISAVLSCIRAGSVHLARLESQEQQQQLQQQQQKKQQQHRSSSSSSGQQQDGSAAASPPLSALFAVLRGTHSAFLLLFRLFCRQHPLLVAKGLQCLQNHLPLLFTSCEYSTSYIDTTSAGGVRSSSSSYDGIVSAVNTCDDTFIAVVAALQFVCTLNSNDSSFRGGSSSSREHRNTGMNNNNTNNSLADGVFSMILGVCRKAFLHRSFARKMLAVRALVHLWLCRSKEEEEEEEEETVQGVGVEAGGAGRESLFAVPSNAHTCSAAGAGAALSSSQQLEIVQTLLYVLALPAICRRQLYCSLLCVLQHCTSDSIDNKDTTATTDHPITGSLEHHVGRGGAYEEEFTSDVERSCSTDDDDKEEKETIFVHRPKRHICKRALLLLRSNLTSKLSAYFTHRDTYDTKSVPVQCQLGLGSKREEDAAAEEEDEKSGHYGIPIGNTGWFQTYTSTIRHGKQQQQQQQQGIEVGRERVTMNVFNIVDHARRGGNSIVCSAFKKHMTIPPSLSSPSLSSSSSSSFSTSDHGEAKTEYLRIFVPESLFEQVPSVFGTVFQVRDDIDLLLQLSLRLDSIIAPVATEQQMLHFVETLAGDAYRSKSSTRDMGAADTEIDNNRGEEERQQQQEYGDDESVDGLFAAQNTFTSSSSSFSEPNNNNNNCASSGVFVFGLLRCIELGVHGLRVGDGDDVRGDSGDDTAAAAARRYTASTMSTNATGSTINNKHNNNHHQIGGSGDSSDSSCGYETMKRVLSATVAHAALSAVMRHMLSFSSPSSHHKNNSSNKQKQKQNQKHQQESTLWSSAWQQQQQQQPCDDDVDDDDDDYRYNYDNGEVSGGKCVIDHNRLASAVLVLQSLQDVLLDSAAADHDTAVQAEETQEREQRVESSRRATVVRAQGSSSSSSSSGGSAKKGLSLSALDKDERDSASMPTTDLQPPPKSSDGPPIEPSQTRRSSNVAAVSAAVVASTASTTVLSSHAEMFYLYSASLSGYEQAAAERGGGISSISATTTSSAAISTVVLDVNILDAARKPKQGVFDTIATIPSAASSSSSSRWHTPVLGAMGFPALVAPRRANAVDQASYCDNSSALSMLETCLNTIIMAPTASSSTTPFIPSVNLRDGSNSSSTRGTPQGTPHTLSFLLGAVNHACCHVAASERHRESAPSPPAPPPGVTAAYNRSDEGAFALLCRLFVRIGTSTGAAEEKLVLRAAAECFQALEIELSVRKQHRRVIKQQQKKEKEEQQQQQRRRTSKGPQQSRYGSNNNRGCADVTNAAVTAGALNALLTVINERDAIKYHRQRHGRNGMMEGGTFNVWENDGEEEEHYDDEEEEEEEDEYYFDGTSSSSIATPRVHTIASPIRQRPPGRPPKSSYSTAATGGTSDELSAAALLLKLKPTPRRGKPRAAAAKANKRLKSSELALLSSASSDQSEDDDDDDDNDNDIDNDEIGAFDGKNIDHDDNKDDDDYSGDESDGDQNGCLEDKGGSIFDFYGLSATTVTAPVTVVNDSGDTDFTASLTAVSDGLSIATENTPLTVATASSLSLPKTLLDSSADGRSAMYSQANRAAYREKMLKLRTAGASTAAAAVNVTDTARNLSPSDSIKTNTGSDPENVTTTNNSNTLDSDTNINYSTSSIADAATISVGIDDCHSGNLVEKAMQLLRLVAITCVEEEEEEDEEDNNNADMATNTSSAAAAATAATGMIMRNNSSRAGRWDVPGCLPVSVRVAALKVKKYAVNLEKSRTRLSELVGQQQQQQQQQQINGRGSNGGSHSGVIAPTANHRRSGEIVIDYYTGAPVFVPNNQAGRGSSSGSFAVGAGPTVVSAALIRRARKAVVIAEHQYRTASDLFIQEELRPLVRAAIFTTRCHLMTAMCALLRQENNRSYYNTIKSQNHFYSTGCSLLIPLRGSNPPTLSAPDDVQGTDDKAEWRQEEEEEEDSEDGGNTHNAQQISLAAHQHFWLCRFFVMQLVSAVGAGVTMGTFKVYIETIQLLCRRIIDNFHTFQMFQQRSKSGEKGYFVDPEQLFYHTPFEEPPTALSHPAAASCSGVRTTAKLCDSPYSDDIQQLFCCASATATAVFPDAINKGSCVSSSNSSDDDHNTARATSAARNNADIEEMNTLSKLGVKLLHALSHFQGAHTLAVNAVLDLCRQLCGPTLAPSLCIGVIKSMAPPPPLSSSSLAAPSSQASSVASKSVVGDDSLAEDQEKGNLDGEVDSITTAAVLNSKNYVVKFISQLYLTGSLQPYSVSLLLKKSKFDHMSSRSSSSCSNHYNDAARTIANIAVNSVADASRQALQCISAIHHFCDFSVSSVSSEKEVSRGNFEKKHLGNISLLPDLPVGVQPTVCTVLIRQLATALSRCCSHTSSTGTKISSSTDAELLFIPFNSRVNALKRSGALLPAVAPPAPATLGALVGTSIDVWYLSCEAFQVCNCLWQLFSPLSTAAAVRSDIGSPVASTAGSSSSIRSTKLNRDIPAPQPLLIDSVLLSQNTTKGNASRLKKSTRVSAVVSLVNKVLAQASKECSALLKIVTTTKRIASLAAEEADAMCALYGPRTTIVSSSSLTAQQQQQSTLFKKKLRRRSQGGGVSDGNGFSSNSDDCYEDEDEDDGAYGHAASSSSAHAVSRASACCAAPGDVEGACGEEEDDDDDDDGINNTLDDDSSTDEINITHEHPELAKWRQEVSTALSSSSSSSSSGQSVFLYSVLCGQRDYGVISTIRGWLEDLVSTTVNKRFKQPTTGQDKLTNKSLSNRSRSKNAEQKKVQEEDSEEEEEDEEEEEEDDEDDDKEMHRKKRLGAKRSFSSPSPSPAAAAAPFLLTAAALHHVQQALSKLLDLELKLFQLLREVDKPTAKVSAVAKANPRLSPFAQLLVSVYTPQLSHSIRTVDTLGRDLLAALTLPDAANFDERHATASANAVDYSASDAVTKNRKRKTDDFDDDDNDDDDDLQNIEYDEEEDEDHLSRVGNIGSGVYTLGRNSVSLQSQSSRRLAVAAAVALEQHKKRQRRRREVDGLLDRYSAIGTSTGTATSGRGGRRKGEGRGGGGRGGGSRRGGSVSAGNSSNGSKVRSRNPVIDKWLRFEDGGGDTYADLEDFLV